MTRTTSAPIFRRMTPKINNFLKLILMALFVSRVVFADEAMPPNGFQSQKEFPGKGCPNLSGTYIFYGKNTPGMPDYYRVHALKLSLDSMLGIDLPPETKSRATHVQLVQDGNIQAMFLDNQERLIAHKLIIKSGDNISCSQNKFIMQRKLAASGEAVSGVNNVTNTVIVGGDGSLVVRQVLSGRGRTLIFSWANPTEEYEAHFARVSDVVKPTR